jgi:hypothetical protein
MSAAVKRVFSPKLNNNIAPLRKTSHLRLVKLDLDSPKMAEAIRNLGLIKSELNTKLKRENFANEDPRITELQF